MPNIFGKNRSSGTGGTIPANLTYFGVTDTSSPVALDLPLLSSVGNGAYYIIKDETDGAGTNNITISPSGADAIDGVVTPITIGIDGGSVILFARDTSWWIIQANLSSGGGGGVDGPLSTTINALPRWADGTGTTLADSTLIYNANIVNRADNAASDTSDASSLTIRAADKTNVAAASGDGGDLILRSGSSISTTGNSGDIILDPGSSAGGSVGNIVAQTNIVFNTDNVYTVGTLTEAAISSSSYLVNLQSLSLYDSFSDSIKMALKSFTMPSTIVAYGIQLSDTATDVLGFATSNDSVADSNATQGVRIETGNKTAGTGDSGSIFLSTGTSSSGLTGSIRMVPGGLLTLSLESSGGATFFGASQADILFNTDGGGSLGTIGGNRPLGVHAVNNLSVGDAAYLITQNEINTADGTPATLQTVTVSTDSFMFIESRVIGVCISGSPPGTTGDNGWFIIRARVKNVSGIVTVESTQISSSRSLNNWDANIIASGSNAIVQVTGVTGNDISWSVTSITQQI